jgi:hypothetical protein
MPGQVVRTTTSRNSMSVFLLATLDTKGPDAAFVRDRLRAMGVDVTVVDTGCLGSPAFAADVTRDDVFEAAGTTLADVLCRDVHEPTVETAHHASPALVRGKPRATGRKAPRAGPQRSSGDSYDSSKKGDRHLATIETPRFSCCGPEPVPVFRKRPTTGLRPPIRYRG